MRSRSPLGQKIARRRRDPHLRLDTAALALKGERAARRYLERRGYLTLQQRFRTRQGEIDLVMQDGEVIVFVEVKARRSVRAGNGLEAVTPRKGRRMVAAGHAYLRMHRLTHREFRYDVVAVDCSKVLARIEHIKRALGP